jgi:hypothetical protein
MKKSPIVILLLLLTVTICRAQYVTLRLNLVQGATYHYNSVANVNVTTTTAGHKTDITTIVTGRVSFKVVGIRDSLYDMEMRYDYLGVKMQLLGTTVDYNSDKGDLLDPANGIFSAFKGQVLNMVMTKSGNVESIKGFGAMLDRIVAKFPGADPAQMAQLKGMVEKSFGEDAFRSNLETGMTIFPSVPVRKGVFWTSDTQLMSASPAKVHTIYELRDIADTYYHIHANSTISFPDKDKYMSAGGQQMRYNLGGSMSADIVVDKVTGWLKQSTIIQNIGGSTEIKGSPQIPAGMVMPIVMKSDITVTGDN